MIEKIQNTISHLQKGNTILYPTDTVWGLGCDATNYDAIKKVYKLKKRNQTKTMIILVDSITMLKKYIHKIPEVAYNIIKLSTKPTTIIYDNPINIAENLIATDNTLAIRIPKDNFCQQLIKQFKKPIVSTSANLSDEPTPKHFSQINPQILKEVDHIVNLHQDKITNKPSSIIKLGNDGTIKIIRK